MTDYERIGELLGFVLFAVLGAAFAANARLAERRRRLDRGLPPEDASSPRRRSRQALWAAGVVGALTTLAAAHRAWALATLGLVATLRLSVAVDRRGSRGDGRIR